MSVVCFGELLIDFVALETGVTVGDASGFQKAPGGAPANVAVAIRRLGHPAAFIGQVGDDPFGHYLADVLKAENVDTTGLLFSKAARTALAFVSLREDGERSFVFYRHPSADMLLQPADIAFDMITQAKIFHFGSITMISEPSRAATLAAAQHAHSNRLLISYDPNIRLSLWSDEQRAREGMLVGLNYANIVKVSEEEVIFLTGSTDINTLWRDQIQIIIVTQGEKGATVHTKREKFTLPGFKVDTVDTTGAGDAFVAGVLVGILEHWGEHLQHMEEIVRFANGVGALATTKRGAIPALPTRTMVDGFIKLPK